MTAKKKTVIKVVHCDYCDIKHETREAAIKCCGVMRVQVYYKCLLCEQTFKSKDEAKICAAYHLIIKETRKREIAKYLERVQK